MRFLKQLLVMALAFSFGVNAQINTKDPAQLIQQVTTQTLNKIENQPELLKPESKELIKLINIDLLPHVHYKFSSLKVMGIEARKTKPDERERFYEAFNDYMVGTFALIFKEYKPKKQKLIVEPMRIKGQVPAKFVSEGKPDISIIFYLRENTKTKDWQVWDIAAEGISQVETKGKELRPLIRKHGLDYVTMQLRAKMQRGLTEEDLIGVKKP